ncbi:hypothetical protein DFH11DRAFT_875276 [Phellopilus nigrolimitatus]|nr:hypothetical protein DFH11DRAFT_875276 [Phellopilus nigrolimitatus]
MAPCKPAKAIKIRVPRQNAQRLGPSLTAEIRAVSRQDGIVVQLSPPVQEQPSSAGPSSENASEWNSLLLSARAQRGPFWDVGTQQFLVEKESELYYDPTPLLQVSRSLTNGGQREGGVQIPASQQQQQQQHQQQQQQQQQRNAFANQQYGYANSAGTPMMGHATPARNMAFPGTPGGVPSGQFYGDSMTPTRPGMMDGVNASPEVYGRRITRGMSDGYQGYGN